jgi:hypothetical protein
MPRAAARSYLSIELRRDALVQRLADDIYPAFRAELGQDARDVGVHGPAGQEHAARDLAAGRLRLRAHKSMPMRDAAEAHRQLESGTVHERIILTLE